MGNRVELDAMGKKILEASRTELFLSMRFLGPALHSLGFVMDLSTTTVGTDAAFIRFNPNYLLTLYLDRPRALNRAWLHMLLHCVFRHMFSAGEREDPELWDLSCDIAVESIIDSMDYSAVAELTPEKRRQVYDRLEAEVRVLTAERIYQYFRSIKMDYLEQLQLMALFARCDHSFWQRMEDEDDAGSDSAGENRENRSPGADDSSGGNKDPDGGNDPGRDHDPDGGNDPGRDHDPDSDNDPGRDHDPDGGNDPGRDHDPDGGNDQDGNSDPAENSHPKSDNTSDPSGKDTSGQGKRPPENRSMEKQVRELQRMHADRDHWEETAKRMEAELAVSGKEASDERGSLAWVLSVTNRRKTDYREFLKKYAVPREVIRLDPDSFDYGFYNYGMEVYGNMPLIEENEYREIRQVRTLIIAIDTSASCREDLVQRFLNETAAILRDIASFFENFEVHILECDEHIQEEILLHDTAEMEQYADHFRMSGGYGTDFRPVFARIEEKRKAGEIRDVAGLLYFTDGMGIYPDKATDYDTAFVFLDEADIDERKVPDWAIRLYIQGDSLKIRADAPAF